jgi:hypothetical protein
MRKMKVKANYRRIVLRLPDLDHSKVAVLNDLSSSNSRRVYQHAIEQFIAGIAPNPAWRSIELLWSATGCTSNREDWPPIP